jgi:hypothetical protein
LILLGINNVYCPDCNTAAILMHEKNVDELTEKFSKAKVILKSAYNHMNSDMPGSHFKYMVSK